MVLRDGLQYRGSVRIEVNSRVHLVWVLNHGVTGLMLGEHRGIIWLMPDVTQNTCWGELPS